LFGITTFIVKFGNIQIVVTITVIVVIVIAVKVIESVISVIVIATLSQIISKKNVKQKIIQLLIRNRFDKSNNCIKQLFESEF